MRADEKSKRFAHAEIISKKEKKKLEKKLGRK